MEKELSDMRSRIQELQDDLFNKRYWLMSLNTCFVMFILAYFLSQYSDFFLFSFKLLREPCTQL